jgi:hypothetical protein
MRDIVSFDGHGATGALLVLVTAAVLRAAAAVAAHSLQTRHQPAPAG